MLVVYGACFIVGHRLWTQEILTTFDKVVITVGIAGIMFFTPALVATISLNP